MLFVNMSSDRENEYFSAGIAEENLNALSKIEGLYVTARTSSFAFKNQHILLSFNLYFIIRTIEIYKTIQK